MKAVIFKYRIPNGGGEVSMPEGARCLKLAMLVDGLYVWALVDPAQPVRARKFSVIGTGQDFEMSMWHVYLDTVEEGPFIWHVFEVLG